MCRFLVLATLAVLMLPASAGARPLPGPVPLGMLVRKSKTIHVLEIVESDVTSVSFKTTAALKGKLEDVPFRSVLHVGTVGFRFLFENGDTVLCFLQEDPTREEGEAVALLFVRGRWTIACRVDKGWGWGYEEDRYAVTYVGTTAALREHVTTILARRDTTITARAPQAWNAVGRPRLWRIKAGPGVTRFVLSEDSPYFVGWGTGESDEVPKLIRALESAFPQGRIAAAADLAHLGAAARPALPVLRRALEDRDFYVSLAAAQALGRLGKRDEAIQAIKVRLRDVDVRVRCAAADALGDLGPVARSALPDLLEALADKEGEVRAAVAAAVGPVVADTPEQWQAIAALVALLKEEAADEVRLPAIRSLHRLGPLCWSATPTLRQSLVQANGLPRLSSRQRPVRRLAGTARPASRPSAGRTGRRGTSLVLGPRTGRQAARRPGWEGSGRSAGPAPNAEAGPEREK